jgi:tetratricopeptide (TPR) repeat protein
VIETKRHDDVLGALADAAQGTLVAAELPDQAGAVRDLVASYKRATATESRTQRGRPRAWIPLLLALVVLGAQTATRRTAALVALALCVALPAGAQQAVPARPRSAAEKAWDRGNAVAAALAYIAELSVRQDDDTAWYNAGTAALAAGDADAARASLARAAASLDPDLRFRALYNLGLVALAQARADSGSREAHLADAERAYREALLLKPRHLPAKWNLELVTRMRSSGASRPNPQTAPPSAGGGGAPPDQPRGGGGGTAPGQGAPSPGGLNEAQADQVLRSIGQEELRTRRDRAGRTRRAVAVGVRDW